MSVSQAVFAMPASDLEVAKEQPFDRALAVLETVTSAERAVSVTDIATECGLPVPTVHRMVGQLERRGLLKRVLGSRRVVVGHGLVKLGIAALESALRADRPHQILLAFVNQIGEHCQIATRSDNSIFYVDTAQAVRSNGLHFEQGKRAPLHCTSIGKLYLAQMSEVEFESWLARAPLERIGPRTVVSASALRTVVKSVKRQGWAMSNEEIAAGVVGCAVPIRDLEGRMLAGLGVSVPNARVPFDQLARFRAPLESAAAEIAGALFADS